MFFVMRNKNKPREYLHCESYFEEENNDMLLAFQEFTTVFERLILFSTFLLKLDLKHTFLEKCHQRKESERKAPRPYRKLHHKQVEVPKTE